MRFFWQNLIDVSGVVFTSTSEASSALGPENVAHEFKTKVWRTGTSTADESITFDLGSAQAATSVILLAHTLTASDTDIQLRASTDNFAADDDLIATLTHADDVITATFNSASYRYWRIVFTKSAAGESRDIGRVFLGTYYDTTIDPDWDGASIMPEDLSLVARGIGGQVYVDRRGQYRMVKVDFSSVPHAMKEQLKTIGETLGKHTNLFVSIQPSASGELGETMYCKLSKLAGREADGMDSDVTWAMRMELEEQI